MRVDFVDDRTTEELGSIKDANCVPDMESEVVIEGQLTRVSRVVWFPEDSQVTVFVGRVNPQTPS
jgi:hypothetical protein